MSKINLPHFKLGRIPFDSLLLSDTWPNSLRYLGRGPSIMQNIFFIFFDCRFYFGLCFVFAFLALIDDLHKPDPYAK